MLGSDSCFSFCFLLAVSEGLSVVAVLVLLIAVVLFVVGMGSRALRLSSCGPWAELP